MAFPSVSVELLAVTTMLDAVCMSSFWNRLLNGVTHRLQGLCAHDAVISCGLFSAVTDYAASCPIGGGSARLGETQVRRFALQAGFILVPVSACYPKTWVSLMCSA